MPILWMSRQQSQNMIHVHVRGHSLEVLVAMGSVCDGAEHRADHEIPHD